MQTGDNALKQKTNLVVRMATTAQLTLTMLKTARRGTWSSVPFQPESKSTRAAFNYSTISSGVF